MLSQVFKLGEMEIPKMGFGTRNLQGQPLRKVLTSALYYGYKHIDTSPYFGNEWMIGEVIKNTDREKIFITSKIPAYSLDYPKTVSSVEKTLKNLKTEYLDLVLLGSPGKAELKGSSRMNEVNRNRAYEALQSLKRKGIVKNIGVANFLPKHIDKMWDKFEFNPVANQIEFHPLCFSQEILDYHREKNIQIIGTSPFANMNPNLWKSNAFNPLKKKFKITKSHIILKWCLQKGVAIIPKTGRFERLKSNTLLDFELEEEDMKVIESLSSNMTLGWKSDTIS